MDLRERFGEYQDSMRAALDGRQAAIWTAFPAIVDTVNLTALTLTCTPAIQVPVTQRDGTKVMTTLPNLLDVPIIFPRGGGYSMTFPIKQGDECLVMFSCRNIDAWWQNGGIQAAMTVRMHDLSDGFALVGPYSQPQVIENISATTAQFRSDSGDEYVELNEAGGVVTVKAPQQVILDTPLVSCTGQMNVLNQHGQTVALSVYGSENVQGTLSASVDVIGGTGTGAISLTKHEHYDPDSNNPTNLTGGPVG